MKILNLTLFKIFWSYDGNNDLKSSKALEWVLI